jgi:hypothetical protein
VSAETDREQWYRRRVAALESLLARYRVGAQRVPEKLFDELAATRERIDDKGNWIGGGGS